MQLPWPLHYKWECYMWLKPQVISGFLALVQIKTIITWLAGQDKFYEYSIPVYHYTAPKYSQKQYLHRLIVSIVIMLNMQLLCHHWHV